MAKRTLPCGEDELSSWEGKAFLRYLGEPSGVKESWRSGDGDRGRVTQAHELRGQENRVSPVASRNALPTPEL